MAVKLFSKIEGGVAIVRKSPGVLVQCEIYSRAGQVFIKASGGFVRIADKFGDEYLTVLTSLKVLELEGDGVKLQGTKAPAFSIGGWGPVE